MVIPIDFAASEPHFADHLAPVALEAMLRGHEVTFYVKDECGDVAGRHPGLATVLAAPTRERGTPITVCAAWGDARNAIAHKRRVVLMEHGAGQSYSDRNPSYVGGTGREQMVGVLVPNEAAAERHRRFYRSGPPAVVIGSPRVDALRARYLGRERDDPPAVAISWHWSAAARTLPETGSAFDELGTKLLPELLRLERLGWVGEVLGHAHPRASAPLEAYRRLGIKVVETFDEVCERADLYIVDNSSTLFEFAALGRPVVVVNAPSYRRRIDHGLRFWAAAGVGPNVWRRRDLAYGLAAAIEDGPARQMAREEAVAMAYGRLDGHSAARAVDAVVDLA